MTVKPVMVSRLKTRLTSGIWFVLSIEAALGAISFCAKSDTTCLNCLDQLFVSLPE